MGTGRKKWLRKKSGFLMVGGRGPDGTDGEFMMMLVLKSVVHNNDN